MPARKLRVCKKCRERDEALDEKGHVRRGYCEECEPLCRWGRNMLGVSWGDVSPNRRPDVFRDVYPEPCQKKTKSRSKFCADHPLLWDNGQLSKDEAHERLVHYQPLEPVAIRAQSEREDRNATRHGG